MSKKRFFKGKYAIALYDKEDYLAYLFDNLIEIKNIQDEKTYKSIKNAIYNTCLSTINGKKYSVFLIDMTEENTIEKEVQNE